MWRFEHRMMRPLSQASSQSSLASVESTWSDLSGQQAREFRRHHALHCKRLKSIQGRLRLNPPQPRRVNSKARLQRVLRQQTLKRDNDHLRRRLVALHRRKIVVKPVRRLPVIRDVKPAGRGAYRQPHPMFQRRPRPPEWPPQIKILRPPPPKIRGPARSGRRYF